MSDLTQVVIVTIAAAGALVVLLRPLLVSDKEPKKPGCGCDACGTEKKPASDSRR